MSGKHAKGDDYEGQSDNSGKAPVKGGRASRLRIGGHVKAHEAKKKGKS